MSDVLDDAGVIGRLEAAGRTLMALPERGPSTKLRSSALEVLRSALEVEQSMPVTRLRLTLPSGAEIDAMDVVWGWLGLIPPDRYVLRRIVGARALVNPANDRHLFSWRRLGGLLSADHKAVQRWHAEGIARIVAGLGLGAKAVMQTGLPAPAGQGRRGPCKAMTPTDPFAT